VNFIHIAGHLGADPETRFTSSGKKVTTLRVATRTRKGQVDDTIWWRVTIWGDQYDKMLTYFKKGSSIVVAGELQKPDIFNDREGKAQISMEITAAYIQFSPFGKPGSGSSNEGGESSYQPPQGQKNMSAASPPFGSFPESAPNPYMSSAPVSSGKGETFDDEIPF
jgi:single-strand DNA-binding protein